ncbi:TerC family protein [Xylanimonas oleitrophica]|uniref:TerC family protein n=1 Tax=Xylanimonas oleitrophica TaxID=2607479 RepID=A0A2W5XQQ4_9MICO|nr:TerC family protein [Xylanimonas oleitrophica]PZR51918.1 TerC family protein [Xylanimonas oleitrophica]
MTVPFWVWAVTVGAILAMLTVDYLGHVRTPHAPSLREAARWSIAYVAVAVVFGFIVWSVWGSQYGTEYFAGYITEKSLSVDNLFVFVLILSSFRVPREYQQKVLLIGITIALVLRTVFIFLGVAIIENFASIFYLFGAFLIWTAIAQARHSGEQEEFHENGVLRLVRRFFPTTDTYVQDKLTARVDGRRHITPMLIVMIAIGSADVLFAVDSIPAIFGLTQEAYLVFTANAFSLLGLRQLYFLIDGLLDRLVYLNYGLAAILGFIGVKLLIHALHTNEVPFINDGEHVEVIPEVPTQVSLTFIVVVLTITTVASLYRDRKVREAQALAEKDS